MRAYALYRGRSLLVFPGEAERDEYVARFFRWEDVRPATEREAEAWRPAHQHARKIAIWRDGGRWSVRHVKPGAV